MIKNVVLIGYMGSGKSYVGKTLASRFEMDYVDLDDFIEQKEDCSINEIFKNKGEVYFRKVEAICLNECLNNLKNTVLSLGGGTPCFGNNMEAIVNATNSRSVYLQTSVKELAKRLFSEKAKRPLIAHTNTIEELTEFVAKHIFERTEYYLKSEMKIITTDKSIVEIINEIDEKINFSTN